MKEFEHINAKTIDEAISLLSEVEGAVAIAGGTDLLTVMKSEILSPKRLVNIKTIPNLDQIKHIDDQWLSIGALSSLSQINRDEMVKDSCGILIQAINRIATPQIRNVGTIGGNLCQKPRCWYYRNPSFQCFRKGGKICFAVRGENRYNAILDGSPCFMVHPSDLATVLMALDAKIDIVGSDGEKSIPIDDFFVNPKVSLKETNVLKPSELITEIKIPKLDNRSKTIFLKESERKTWDFAIVSVALKIELDGDRINSARIVLGGVSPTPFRAREAEKLLEGNSMDRDLIDAVSDEVTSKNRSLKGNEYKVSLAKSLVKRSLLEINTEKIL